MSPGASGNESIPLVSVLIPAFNHERFVERCLDSVLEDPYPAKEIVIIDDGSSDGTASRIADWVARHGDEVVVRFRARPNRGVAATLNELVGLAGGRFLRLGASDDYLLPGSLQAQVSYLQAQAGKVAVIGDSIVVDAQGRMLHSSGMEGLHGADKRHYRTDQGIRRAVISHWAVGGAVAMIRRDALVHLGGWDEGLHIEDWDLFLRLAARDTLGFIDMPVCAYRLHADNASRTRALQQRLRNLQESLRVARLRQREFTGPDRILMRAQVRYIAAKIALLRRRPVAGAWQLLAWSLLRVAAACDRRVAASLATRHA
jgi:glycosyltransferase involved in cell wall biosynthesis